MPTGEEAEKTKIEAIDTRALKFDWTIFNPLKKKLFPSV